jgi:cysteine desulfurase
MMKANASGGDPEVNFNGDISSDSLYTVLSIHFPDDGKGEMLIYNMDIEGIACSGGSACSSGSNKGSHVHRGVVSRPHGANIRFSFSKFNTEAEVDRAVEVLHRVMAPVVV